MLLGRIQGKYSDFKNKLMYLGRTNDFKFLDKKNQEVDKIEIVYTNVLDNDVWKNRV